MNEARRYSNIIRRWRISRARLAQQVEHILGKDGVSSSILLAGSIFYRDAVDDGHGRGGVAQLVRAHGSYP